MKVSDTRVAQVSGSSYSAQGRRRANEDSCALAAHADGWYVVVADGMGGGIDGSRFSMLAVQSLTLTLTSVPLLDRRALEYAVTETVAAVHQLRLSNAAYHSSGTTLVCAVLKPHAGGAGVSLANIGDSRAYLITAQGPAQQLTLDHTYGEQLMAGGLDRRTAEQHPQSAHLTYVLGDGIPVSQIPNCFSDLQLMPGEFLLLCSDGVAKILSTAQLADIVRRTPTEQVAAALVDAALAAGSLDNATAAVLQIRPAEQPHHEPTLRNAQTAQPALSGHAATLISAPAPAAGAPAPTVPTPAAARPPVSRRSPRNTRIVPLLLALIALTVALALFWYAVTLATAAPTSSLPPLPVAAALLSRGSASG